MKDGNTLTDLAFVNALYKQAFGIDYDIFNSTNENTVYEDITEGVFTDYYNGSKLPALGGRDAYTINNGSKYHKFLVDNLYGGRRLVTGNVKAFRTQLATIDNLVVGDVFFRRTTKEIITYLYIGGDTFVNLNSSALNADSVTINRRLDLAHCAAYYYGVLRPSYGMEG